MIAACARLNPRNRAWVIYRAIPIEGRVLCVTFAEAPSDLGLHQFSTAIEGMWSVAFDPKHCE
jgi:hypothetical protein